MRLFIIIALLWLVLGLISWWHRRGPTIARKGYTPVLKMVQCEYCGTYFPSQEAVHAGGRIYCSNAHRHASDKQTRS